MKYTRAGCDPVLCAKIAALGSSTPVEKDEWTKKCKQLNKLIKRACIEDPMYEPRVSENTALPAYSRTASEVAEVWRFRVGPFCRIVLCSVRGLR